MPTLTISPTYSSNSVLFASQLDVIRDAVQTFFNTTKLDSDNVDLADIVTNISSDEASVFLQKRGLGVTAQGTRKVFSVTVNTTYTDITSVTVPSDGTYMIIASGIAQLGNTSAGSVGADITSVITSRFYNATSSTSIGYDFIIADAYAGLTRAINSRWVSYPIHRAYITTLTASDVIKLQAILTGNLVFNGQFRYIDLQLVKLLI